MDLKALDQATDYKAVLDALFGNLDKKGEGVEIYMVSPMRPEEKIAEQRFSINLRNGMWHDHKTGNSGNMLSLAKKHGPTDWRRRWIDVCPAAERVFGTRSKSTKPRKESASTTTTDSAESSFDPASVPDAAGVPSSLFARVAQAAGVTADPKTPKRKAAAKEPNQTFAAKALRGQKMTSDEEFKHFTDAWKVSIETLVNAGAWAFTHDRGALAGQPQLHFPMIDPATGLTVGIKKRGLGPIYKMGDKVLKSRNEKGSKIGLFPWNRAQGNKPLLLVEGEKDWAVTQEEYGDKFDVVANLGGASTFKGAWVEAIQSKWKDIYICYDADAAGAKGSRKAATLLRGADREVRIVSLPVTGSDLFDLLRTEAGDRGLVDAAFASAEPLGELAPGEVDGYIRAKVQDDDIAKDDWKQAQILYQVMEDNGALFYADEDEAYCSWRNKVYRVTGGSHEWNLLIASYAGVTMANQNGRKLHSNLTSLACVNGKEVESGRWTHYDGTAIYLQLYDDKQSLVRIAADSISIVPNGWNDIVFLPTKHVPPVEFMPDEVYNHADAEDLYEGIWQHLNCAPKWQEMTSAIVRSFFLYDFMQTHPIIRFQGSAGSGKSTAQQFLGLLLYGHKDLIGDITAAAMFRVAKDMPVILQDDLEDKDVGRQSWVQKFYLRCAMGGLRLMSSADSQKDTVNQQVNCWIVNSGIHSIADDTPALNERLIVIPVRDARESDNRFAPMPVFAGVKKGRSLLWNFIYREIQRVLDAIQHGALTRVMDSLDQSQRPRLHEMYAVMSLVRGSYDEADHMTKEWLASATRGERKAVVESSHVSELLYYLPSFLGHGSEGSGHASASNFKDLRPRKDNGLWTCQMDANTIHAVLARMARDTGLKYHLPNARRLGGELRSLRNAGAQEGIALEYDNKVKRVGGRLVRQWYIEIDVATVRAIPSSSDADQPPAGESDEDIPF